jgi:4-diphosphocytidyl-2-C-methyl-D-erythritol kinase
LFGLIRADSVSSFVGLKQQQALFTDRHAFQSSIRSSATEADESSSAESTQGTLSLFSPCKINLFLRILRKREDGFHDLASLFQSIGFGDTLELSALEESADQDVFSCNMAGVPVDSSNLVLRALELMRKQTGTQQFFNANLIKQVPAQAGLGGGSANAATAMWGANELMGRPASVDQVRAFL